MNINLIISNTELTSGILSWALFDLRELRNFNRAAIPLDLFAAEELFGGSNTLFGVDIIGFLVSLLHRILKWSERKFDSCGTVPVIA